MAFARIQLHSDRIRATRIYLVRPIQFANVMYSTVCPPICVFFDDCEIFSIPLPGHDAPVGILTDIDVQHTLQKIGDQQKTFMGAKGKTDAKIVKWGEIIDEYIFMNTKISDWEYGFLKPERF